MGGIAEVAVDVGTEQFCWIQSIWWAENWEKGWFLVASFVQCRKKHEKRTKNKGSPTQLAEQPGADRE